jgi:hypothetical protein
MQICFLSAASKLHGRLVDMKMCGRVTRVSGGRPTRSACTPSDAVGAWLQKVVRQPETRVGVLMMLHRRLFSQSRLRPLRRAGGDSATR